MYKIATFTITLYIYLPNVHFKSPFCQNTVLPNVWLLLQLLQVATCQTLVCHSNKVFRYCSISVTFLLMQLYMQVFLSSYSCQRALSLVSFNYTVSQTISPIPYTIPVSQNKSSFFDPLSFSRRLDILSLILIQFSKLQIYCLLSSSCLPKYRSSVSYPDPVFHTRLSVFYLIPVSKTRSSVF